MARPPIAEKIKKVGVNPHWRASLLSRTKEAVRSFVDKGRFTEREAKDIELIMYSRLWEKDPNKRSYLGGDVRESREAEAIFKHLLLELGNEKEAFSVMIQCAIFSMNHARILAMHRTCANSEVVTVTLFDKASRRGRTRDMTYAQIIFIPWMRACLLGENGRLAERLFESIYKFTFGKTVHLPNHMDLVGLAEMVLPSRIAEMTPIVTKLPSPEG